MKISLKNTLLLLACLGCSHLFGQEQSNSDSPKVEFKETDNFKPNGKLGFLFMGGYAFGLNDETSGTGSYVADDQDIASNNFYLKYARISGKYNLSPKLQADLLFNLADFKSGDVSRKILEIASLTYKYNKALNLKVGQFRPYFGIESMYGITKNKSYAWSENYSMMGKNNWQSFQLGASIFGDLNQYKIPVRYYLNAYNGNGKNAIIDNDSSKNFSSRLVLTAIPNVELGANYATTNYLDKNVKAVAFDFRTNHNLTNKLKLNTEFNYAFGNNLADAMKAKAVGNAIDDYKFRGWFFVPQFIYDLNSKEIESLEFSMRYEGLYTNLDANKNLLTSFVPMLSLNLKRNVKASVVGVFNRYDKEIIDKKLMDTDYMLIQFKFDY